MEVEPQATRRHKVALRPAASPDIQDGPIQLVTLAGGEQLEPIAGDAAGGCFLLVGTGTDRPVLYVGSEGEGGLVANSLREALSARVS